MAKDEISLKFNNRIDGEKDLQKYEERLQNIYSLLSGIQRGQKDFIKSKSEIEQVAKQTNNFNKELKITKNKIDTVFDYEMLSKYFNKAISVFSKMTDLTKKSVAYVENVNLLEVAYQNMNETIEESSSRIESFVDKMADVYGLDESDLTRKLGVFKQLSNAMKLPTETAEHLSEIMVKMTNDIASLYNLDLNRASNALQSALAGQVRPIRSATGADITEKTLQQTVDALGLDRSINQLSYVEKRLIMVISLTDQLKKSQGDYARTIDSASNQIRIMREQWERLSRAVGNTFYPVLEKVLPYVNAILMVLTEIFNIVANLLGFKMPKFDYSSLTAMDDATLDLYENMENAGESVDKLKDKIKGLRGFDKLNVISTPSASSKAGVGSGIDPKILNAFNDAFSNYNDMMDKVRMKARDIRDNIMEWLGFTKLIDSQTGAVSFKFDHITSGTVLGALAVGGVIFKGIQTVGGILKKLGLIKGSGELATNLKGVTSQTKTLLKSIKDGTIISSIGTKLSKLVPILTKVTKGIAGITLAISGSSGLVKQFQTMDVSTEKTTKNTLSLVGGMTLVGSIFGPLGAVIGATTGMVTSFGISIVESNKYLNNLAKSQVFGTLNVSVEQFTEMLGKSGIAVKDLSSRFETFKSSIGDLDNSFQSNIEQLGLYGITYGVLSKQITEQDLPNIVSAIENTTSSATQIVDETTGYLMQSISEFFAQSSSLSKEEQANILNNIFESGEKQKNEIQDIQNKVIEIYANAKAQNRGLNDQEYKDVMEHLTRLKELEIGEVSYTNAELEYLHQRFNDKSMKLDEESYANWKTARDNFETEQMGKIKANYETQYNMLAQLHKKNMMSDEQYNKSVKDLQNNRKKNEEELQKALKGYDDQIYKDLANTYKDIEKETDRTHKTQKKAIENIFKNINVDKKEIISKFADAGNQAGISCATSIQKGFNSKNLKLNVDLTQAIPSAKNIALPFTASLFAGGGVPKVGQFFYANENGPELVDEVGGQTFVANQRQIGNFLDEKFKSQKTSINPTFIIKVGDEELSHKVINDLQDMATTNGSPIVIGG